MVWLVLLFTVVPLVELWLLLLVGEQLGLWPTLGVVVGTGLTGAWLARREGLRVVRRWREALAEGRMPEEGVLGGLLVLVGGVLLVTPGLLTDVSGFLLLVPATRRLVAARVARSVRARIDSGGIRVVEVRGSGFPGGAEATPRAAVIDGVAEEVEPRPARGEEG